MGKYKRYKNRIEMFLSSERGRRVLNFCYAWGAAIVIIGALFKLLHIPYANQILFIAMITEACVFFISGFEHPYSEYHWEEVFPVLKSKNPLDRPEFSGGGGGGIVGVGGGYEGGGAAVEGTGGGSYGGGTGIVGGFGGGGGGGFGTGSDAGSEQAAGASAGEAVRPTPQQAVSAGMTAMGLNISEEDSETLAESIKKLNEAAEQINKMADLSQATAEYIEKMSQATQNLERFSEVTSSLGAFSDTLIHSCKVISGAGADNEGEETTSGYVEKMSALNDNLADLNRFYEAQLTGLRSQMETVHQINAGLNRIRDLYDSSIVDSSAFRNENERMAQLLGQLNLVYSRLLQAMTVNMPAAGYPQPPAGAYTQQAAQPPYQGYAPQGGSYR